MFEDILGDRKAERDSKRGVPVKLYNYRINPRCIDCGGFNFYIYDSYLSSGSTYTDNMVCNDCSAEWCVTMDRNLKIIKVEKNK